MIQIILYKLYYFANDIRLFYKNKIVREIIILNIYEKNKFNQK